MLVDIAQGVIMLFKDRKTSGKKRRPAALGQKGITSRRMTKVGAKTALDSVQKLDFAMDADFVDGSGADHLPTPD